MSQPPAMSIATRRALVRQITDGDPTLSARAIAAQVGVSKDTVRRDLAEMRLAQSQTARGQAAVEPYPTPDAPHGAPDAPSTQSEDAPTPPSSLVIELDGQLRRDLATMTRTGLDSWEAVATAVSIVAGTYRNAWASGRVPVGVAPRILSCNVAPYEPKGTP